MKIVIYTPNGEIIKAISGPEDQVVANLQLGETWIEVPDSLVNEGLYVEDGQLKTMPEKPVGYFDFDYVTKLWQRNVMMETSVTRAQRNQLLQRSDWTDTASASARLGQELYNQWQIYRQKLRDVTDQPGYPLEIVWPTAPTA
jgi:hypothetical protein